MPNDYHQLLNYFESFIRLYEDVSFIETIIFSDEAQFHISVHVNRHNSRIYSYGNTRDIKKRSLHSSLTALTVNGERYSTIIRKFLIPEIERHGPHNISFNMMEPQPTQQEKR